MKARMKPITKIRTKAKKTKGKNSQTETVMGMQVSTLTPKLREELNLSESQSGVAVVDLKHGSEAAKRGVRPGDVIVDVNNVPVKSAEDLKKVFETVRKSGRKYALVRVSRDKDTAFVTLPTTEEKKDDKKEKGKEDKEDKEE